MKIAVYGATGAIGSRIAAEARARGHEVTGISRRGGDQPGSVIGDALDPEFAAKAAVDHDVVVSALGPSRAHDDGDQFPRTIANLAATLGSARLIVVGGAGSLTVDGVRLVDTAQFPAEYKDEALKGAASLQVLRDAPEDVDWAYLSPAPLIVPGERTGAYQVGLESPVGDQISMEDYAVALLDEIETPRHRRQRFTVAS